MSRRQHSPRSHAAASTSAGATFRNQFAVSSHVRRRDAEIGDPPDSRRVAHRAKPGECLDCVSIEDMSKDARLQSRRSSRAWKAFRTDAKLHRSHGVSPAEVEMLSQVALMGEVYSPRDFLLVLKTLRSALKD